MTRLSSTRQRNDTSPSSICAFSSHYLLSSLSSGVKLRSQTFPLKSRTVASQQLSESKTKQRAASRERGQAASEGDIKSIASEDRIGSMDCLFVHSVASELARMTPGVEKAV